jgi:P2-related tail formation protein
MAEDPQAGSLLPPNVSGLERALEQASARVGDIPVPIDPLWNPATCPARLLPWLAWALSVGLGQRLAGGGQAPRDRGEH